MAGPDNSALVYGDLTMRGITKPVTLDSKFLGSMADKEMGAADRRVRGQGHHQPQGLEHPLEPHARPGRHHAGEDVNIKLQVEGVWRDPIAQPPQMGQRPPQPGAGKK